jgi:flagellar P-ring protein precursor FlgI
MRRVFLITLLILASHHASASTPDVRIKDITDVEGVRENTLTGVGLVTGLAGTGGDSPNTREAASNLIQRFGLRLDPQLRAQLRNDTKQRTDNVSLVVVTAELPVFARPGQRIDVLISAYDDAESLQGGVLVMTPLLGVDDRVYATAAGPLSIGGFSFSGDAATAQKNHPTTGRIPNGAVVEEVVPNDFEDAECINLLLRNASFQTAYRIASAINALAPNTARTINAGTVNVTLPPYVEQVSFISQIQDLRITPDVEARVVVNERTGTVSIGQDVRISQVAITHANLSVVTGETPQVSQPLPKSRGETVVVPRTEIDVVEENRPIQVIDQSATVGDLATALNALGVTPRDLSSIFQQLKTMGALHAKLEFQ